MDVLIEMVAIVAFQLSLFLIPTGLVLLIIRWYSGRLDAGTLGRRYLLAGVGLFVVTVLLTSAIHPRHAHEAGQAIPVRSP